MYTCEVLSVNLTYTSGMYLSVWDVEALGPRRLAIGRWVWRQCLASILGLRRHTCPHSGFLSWFRCVQLVACRPGASQDKHECNLIQNWVLLTWSGAG